MIYIIRHGKTELNKAKVLQGRSNYPLNEEGVRQAEEAAARNCDERSAGISDPGVARQVLVKVYWELCDLFCDECRWANRGAA